MSINIARTIAATLVGAVACFYGPYPDPDFTVGDGAPEQAALAFTFWDRQGELPDLSTACKDFALRTPVTVFYDVETYEAWGGLEGSIGTHRGRLTGNAILMMSREHIESFNMTFEEVMVHEILHALETCELGTRGHADPRIWYEAGGVFSVEYWATLKYRMGR